MSRQFHSKLRRFAATAVAIVALGALTTGPTAAALGATPQQVAADCINDTFNMERARFVIPDNSAVGVTVPMDLSGHEGKVVTFALSLKILHSYRGDLVVTLTSPAGKPFVVSNRAGGPADNIILNNMPVGVFGGQPAAGIWKLNVQDRAPLDAGLIDGWSMTIVGDCSPAVPWSASATPNLPTIDNGTACTSLSVAGPGDASAAKLDITGSHDFRARLSGTLSHNGASQVAFPEGSFPTGAGPLSLANRAVAGFGGSATGTWTLCIKDPDAFGDTGTLATWSVHS